MMRLAAPVVAGIMVFFIGFQLLPKYALATLGEKESSIEDDRQALSATTASVSTRAKFTVHEIVSDAVTVREYLDQDGVVFGLAWKGRAHPDLSGLLGTYFGDYQSMVARRDSGPRPRGGRNSLQGSRVVVEKSGHMRALRGRAYLPSRLPSGMRPNEIN